MSERAAIIGVGLIGQAWAVCFARAGWSVSLWDPDAVALARARDAIAAMLSDLADNAMLDSQQTGAAAARISPCTTLAEALEGASWVQENAPEDVAVKRKLWAEMAPLANDAAILASSTSAIVPARFTEELSNRQRCLAVHPINPPHLVPAVELVPAPWTSDETMRRAETVMRAIGQVPIVLRRAIDGFVVNRLQAALLEEAFRLVEDGVCGAEDVDAAIRDGLALRWSFMGPFETIDLNAPGGVSDYVARYQPLYAGLFPSMQRRADWAGAALARIEQERRSRLPATELAARRRWRDRRLMALLRHKRRAESQLGD